MERRRRTIEGKLAALEDHLHLLRSAFWSIVFGDQAFLKVLAAELRVLVCEASGTEGLLWRLMHDVPIDDCVAIHVVEGVNWDHPLAQGMMFSCFLVNRAGSGDPRRTPVSYPLKKMIKEVPAALIEGEHYTHEQLIRVMAEQMGSAHEDEGIMAAFTELAGTRMGDQSLLQDLLMTQADLVLEIGERLLARAERTTDFVRTGTSEIPPIPIESRNGAANSIPAEYSEPLSSVPPEGSLVCGVPPPNDHWDSDDKEYEFTCFENERLRLRLKKFADRTVRVVVAGVRRRDIAVTGPLPPNDQPTVGVAVTWTDREIRFYVNGVPLGTVAEENGP